MAETIPGGYFLNPDKKSAHDANGNEIPLRSPEKLKREEKQTEDETETKPEAEAPSKKK